MGTEYKINFAPQDFAAFETNVRGKTLDKVLRKAPGFVDTDGETYSFNESDDPRNTWLATVSIQNDGLWICYYSDGDLLTYLMWELLDVCGRLSVENG